MKPEVRYRRSPWALLVVLSLWGCRDDRPEQAPTAAGTGHSDEGDCVDLCPPDTPGTAGWSAARLESEWTYDAQAHAFDQFREQERSHAAELSSAVRFRAWQEGARTLLRRLLRTDLAAGRREVTLDIRILESVQFPGYRRDKIDYLVEPGLRISAYLYVPDAGGARHPAIAIWHGHGAGGKDALAGTGDYREQTDYHRAAARHLAEEGLVVLAPDIRTFGESGDSSSHNHLTLALLLHGQVALGVFLADAWKAIDLLESLPQVDPERIGTAGISLGGQISLLLAATDRRIRLAVVQGFLGSTSLYLDTQHCACQYVPLLGRMFDIADIALMAAPTPLLFVLGADEVVYPASQASEAFVPIQRGYALLDRRDDVRLHEEPGARHEWVHGPAIEWIAHHFGLAEPLGPISQYEVELAFGLVSASDGDPVIIARAERRFRRALGEEPLDDRALFGLGWCAQLRTEYDRALRFYRLALGVMGLGGAADEIEYFTHNNLGWIHRDLNQERAAELELGFSEMLTSDPQASGVTVEQVERLRGVYELAWLALRYAEQAVGDLGALDRGLQAWREADLPAAESAFIEVLRDGAAGSRERGE